ncbi:MAG: ATP-binding protein [Nitrospirae bacterium]|nr:ATP-binding protein [Nitrospirota bacterium]MBF0591846.1 ATP-binding protein [Nitrospirota bacterium]
MRQGNVMRHFYSYGPVDREEHFCVPRTELIEECTRYLLGNIKKGGHYFTIWAPRQTGKTWLMRQVKDEILARHSERFVVGTMSMQGVSLTEGGPVEEFLDKIPGLMKRAFKIDRPRYCEGFSDFFLKDNGLFDCPVILFIDEFDNLPPQLIDRLVNQFRDMYLDRDSYLLHGLALIGVRAVLGVESERGSPFNVQRSMHIPNFSKEEVSGLFQQYINETGQVIEPAVINKVCDVTRGQPGLVGWFGEILTEKYNPGTDNTIDVALFERVYHKALSIEWNNTVLNLIKKARGNYRGHVVRLFAKSDIPFNIDEDWCNYLYFNGIIDSETTLDSFGQEVDICRFTCPFIQKRLYGALSRDLADDSLPVTALDILDTLEDVFEPDRLNIVALLQRYRDYLTRLKTNGLDPWQGQPRRADLRYTEAVGHFHLYAWLQAAIGSRCIISPEFPTGNGKVDIHLRSGDTDGIIEVKSFTNIYDLKAGKQQAAKYAGSLGKDSVTIALFVPSDDKEVQEKLSAGEILDKVKVTVVPIGWT